MKSTKLEILMKTEGLSINSLQVAKLNDASPTATYSPLELRSTNIDPESPEQCELLEQSTEGVINGGG